MGIPIADHTVEDDGSHLRLLYITASMPFGPHESFFIPEVKELINQGCEVRIVPRSPSGEVVNRHADGLKELSARLPLLSCEVLAAAASEVLRHPLRSIGALALLFHSRSIGVMVKNLAVFPKGLLIARLARKWRANHIYAQWASTNATMAMVAAKVARIPWSFTAHRWDIADNNLLKEKCKTANFVRVICEEGRQEIVNIIRDATLAKKIVVIHMGVVMPGYSNSFRSKSDAFTLLCPANLVPKKGHKFLLEACRIISDKGLKFKCLIAGDGPLGNELRLHAERLGIKGRIEFFGMLPHEKILDLYREGEINAVVLPSIVTDDGEREGIPVSLMEAMAYGIPVISTDTGGIPELVGNECGIVVEAENHMAIADAVQRLMTDDVIYRNLSIRGRSKVEKDFNISSVSKDLLTLFMEYGRKI